MLNPTEFTEGFLLKAFMASHSIKHDVLESPYRNDRGYYVHFDDAKIQRYWEEWQACSHTMMIIFNASLKNHEEYSD